MKNTLLFLLFPLLSIGQIQIGADIDEEVAENSVGTSISLSRDGTTLAIGVPDNDGNGTSSGSVRMYKNVSGTWQKIGASIYGEAAYDSSGKSVSLSSDGSIVAIGSIGNDGNGTNSGSVRVYKNMSGTWTQIGTDIDGEAADDYSGTSISLSSDGSIVAIGSNRNDGNGTDSGSVRVYQNVSGTWTQIGADIDGEVTEDYSGSSVSLSSDGTILAVGASHNDGNGTDSGSVRVYQNVSGTWTQIGVDIDGEATDDHSGGSVSLSSDGIFLAVGAVNNDGNGTNSGSVRIYENVLGSWTQIGADINGEISGEWSGTSVSLSSDGSIVAIGANNYINGRVYRNISGIWTKVGVDIDKPGIYNHGSSVSLSSDGSILAIGAPEGPIAISPGKVRVYDLSAVLSSDSFVLANFAVFPNPSSEVVTISLQEGLTLEKVNVYNTLGQLVKTENKNVISVNSLTKGSYYFEIITDKGKATKTILVQ